MTQFEGSDWLRAENFFNITIEWFMNNSKASRNDKFYFILNFLELLRTLRHKAVALNFDSWIYRFLCNIVRALSASFLPIVTTLVITTLICQLAITWVTIVSSKSIIFPYGIVNTAFLNHPWLHFLRRNVKSSNRNQCLGIDKISEFAHYFRQWCLCSFIIPVILCIDKWGYRK